jgi:hypothetical protein
MSTGATDGLFLRNADIPVYGVSGLFGEIDDNRAHGQNSGFSSVRSSKSGVSLSVDEGLVAGGHAVDDC